MLKLDYHTKTSHLTVLNLASLTLPSNAFPTAPIVESGTRAAVSTHHAFPTLAMKARSSVVAKRFVCFTVVPTLELVVFLNEQVMTNSQSI